MIAARSRQVLSRAAARPLAGAARSMSSYAPPTEKGDATIKIEFDVPYEMHRLEAEPASFTYTSKQELTDYFTLMYRMRRMEIAADTLYKGKFVKGFCHLYDGQEAICVGMEAACNETGEKYGDSLVTSYRDHCQQLARGDTMRNVLSELLGRYNPIAKGKGGSMHMYKADSNFFGGNGIVGAQASARRQRTRREAHTRWLGTGRGGEGRRGASAARREPHNHRRRRGEEGRGCVTSEQQTR